MNIQEMPRAIPDNSGFLVIANQETFYDRWITGKTPNGFYAWVGDEYPYPDEWPNKQQSFTDFSQVFGVVDSASEFSTEEALAWVERKTGRKWKIKERYELEKVGFEDQRFYPCVVLEIVK